MSGPQLTVPPRFRVLHFVSAVFKVLAWLILVLSGLSAIAAGVGSVLVRQMIRRAAGPEGAIALGGVEGVLVGVAVFLAGLIYFLLFYAAGEMIQLQLAIEENTRMTAALLLKLEESESAVPEPQDSATGGYYAPHSGP